MRVRGQTSALAAVRPLHRSALTHCEEIPYLMRDRYTPPPRMHPKKMRAARTMSPLVPAGDARRRERNGPSVHRHSRLTVPRAGRIARTGSGDTFDTASMYSTVSAPSDLHEQIMLAKPFSHARAGAEADMVEQAPPAYPPIAARPSVALHALNFVELLAPRTYDKTNAQRSLQLPPPATPVRMPRCPQPVSTPDMLSRTRSYFHPTSRFSITPPPLEPGHLRTSLDPPSPLERKFTPFLYRESSRQTLPSPHSPGPI
ncbi:hypothetical protein HYPSUDRAFT_776840 [Hypholoma sublateritium FD-334 SS-4]|uniref:Uncharacterized protein n=1 Tax=Hypholoma sublateritium (strain FD-334 SS-4) TaxID=945553 RepID=A0A0D2NWA2_HYPSF|nr:hypothetical protein HYPSUDRAFT_776840 [Hypholoma sublateritium FD-334 SS-4]